MKDLLYNLLPAVYRSRDRKAGQPLRAILAIIEEELDLLTQDIEGLYDDWFIETCAEWVVPYIGDLLGVRMLHNIESGGVYSQRALVANTISFRRRKGTLLVLEELARDVTGWGSHAVAFFERLGWTQNLNHLRFDAAANPNPCNPRILNPSSVNRVGTVNLRSLNVLDRLDGPFDDLSHSVDVRPPGQRNGRHNIRNVGLFLWRLQSYPLAGVQACPAPDHADGFHFSPVGVHAPLYTNPQRKIDGKHLSTALNVPGPIHPVAFYQDPEAYYGLEPDKSLAVYRGSGPDPSRHIPPQQILCKDLSTWAPPPGGMVAVDPALGRLAFAPGESPDDGVTVNYHYGFSADIGGGPYDRRTSLVKGGLDDWIVTVAKDPPEPPPTEWRTSIRAAIEDWNPALQPRAVITIADNRTYDETLTLNLDGGGHLVIQADNYNRPTLRLRDNANALSVMTVTGGGGPEALLTLNGLLIEGALHVDTDSLGKLGIAHCTLLPGRALNEKGLAGFPAAPSLDADPDNQELEITIRSSILGALRLPEHMKGLRVEDSVIDRPENDEGDEVSSPPMALAQDDGGENPGPVTVIERATIFGEVLVRTLELASETIFTRRVSARRRQTGCVRYSFIRDAQSITPRRFQCQPDLALAARRKQLGVEDLTDTEQNRISSLILPGFTSMRYGQPGYAQLDPNTGEEIRTGAEHGAEMGVFEHLKQPQREANLRIRLEEYMPYGLEAGIIYVN